MPILTAHPYTVLLMLLLLGLSAFFSGSETALFALPKAELRRFLLGRSAAARAVAALAREPSAFLQTVLFCNMTVNILFFSLSAGLAAKWGQIHGHGAALAASLTFLFTVIVAGEVTPKSLAVLAPGAVLAAAALPLWALHCLLAPVRRLLGGATEALEHLAPGVRPRRDAQITELKLMLEALSEEGVVTRSQTEMMGTVLELSGVRVKEAMTPRVDMVMIEESEPVRELLRLARRTGRSKMPVFRRVRDEIVGVVDAREPFLRKAAGSLRPFLRAPVYVSAYQRADEALRLFHARGIRLAIVTDEYGGTAGILTLADLMAEVFGDPVTEGQRPVEKLGADRFLLAGGLSLREWRTLFAYEGRLPAAVGTVAGLLTARLGRVPHAGDTVRIGRLRMTVREMSRRRVARVELALEPGEDAEREDAS